ncbi:MAG: hypothetical protein FWC76_03645 [Defluviitaleaceae bacterium]|nr:hypothetical protein [Defluviitaleaceae bacterium]
MNENQSTASPKPNLAGYSPKTYLKLIIFSAFGIFAFFINFQLPSYQLSIFGWEFGTVSANSNMLVSHLINFIRAALWTGNFKAMPAIIWLFGVYCLVDMFILRFDRSWRSSKVAAAFSVMKTFGFVFLTFTVAEYYFGFAPGFLSWYFTGVDLTGDISIAFFVMDRLLIMIFIAIPVSAAFLPFLTDYGLVDLVGVLVRRFMRPVFKLPGRAAVIAVSSLLASFVVGHIGSSREYKSGRMTKREGIVVGTSFTSASIGFMIVLAMNADIMHIWNVYLWSTFAILLIVTLISIRLYPLRKISDEYCEGVTPIPESVYTKHIMGYAAKEALDTASNSENLGKSFAKIMKDCAGVLGIGATGTTFFAGVGITLHVFTPLIEWVGFIFWPLMSISLSGAEAVAASAGVILSLIDIILPTLPLLAGEWTLRMRYIMAVIPITSIVFLAAWVPCIMATELPVKFSQLLVIWLVRMVLSIIIVSLFALILFPAGAV